MGDVAADASVTGPHNPKLLLDGFLDINGMRDQLLNKRRFLVLGRKGSGKSALGEHLRLTAEDRYDLFVKRSFLGDFPFAEL